MSDTAHTSHAEVPSHEPENHGHDEHESHEGHEAQEKSQLENALKIVATIAAKGEKAGIGVESAATAARFLRTTLLLAPFRAGWNLLSAESQRSLALATLGETEEWVMKYFPALDPRAYFLPGTFIAALALTGVVPFKLTAEEEQEMEAKLGQHADQPREAGRLAFQAEVEGKIVNNIVLPGEGIPHMITGTPGKLAAIAEPELKPVLKAGEYMEKGLDLRDSFLSKVRARVHTLEVESAEANAIPETVGDTHEDAAYSVNPQAHLHPEAANAPFPEEDGHAHAA